MATDASSAASMFEKLKLEAQAEPCWLPPRPWESIPSESGRSSSSSSSTSHSHCLYHASAVSESSLVRLAMNALQGMESSIITIQKLSALFCSDSADRTSHRISSLWSQALSTFALGNLLKSIGRIGCTVFLLQKFVNCYTSSSSDGNLDGKGQPTKQTLVNQAFAVAVGKVLDAYISALDTLYASVSFRHSSKASDGGFLKTVGNSKVTLLEVHMHTKILRTQIEALGNICNINDLVLSFPVLSFESLSIKANSVCGNFPRGGHLLTFLYSELKVAEPVHYSLLKFLFIQSFEPYCGFIRSWIFEGQISDPYNEFVVEYIDLIPAHGLGNVGITTSTLATVRVRDGVAIPCFLEEFLTPLFRAGQQLQVLIKLLDMCNNVGACDATLEEILRSLNLSSKCRLFASLLTFDKRTLETRVVARNRCYEQMLEKVEKILSKFEFRFHQASACDIQLVYAKNHISSLDNRAVMDEDLVSPSSDRGDQNLPISTVDSETSGVEDEFCIGEDLLDSSESTSLDGSEEHNESERIMINLLDDTRLVPSYLSALDFSFSCPNYNPLLNHRLGETSHSMKCMSHLAYENKEMPGNDLESTNMVKTSNDVCLTQASRDSCLPETTDTTGANCQCDVCLVFGNLQNSVYTEGWNSETAQSDNVDHRQETSSGRLGVLETDMLNHDNSIDHKCSLTWKANSEDCHMDGPCASSSLFSLLSWKLTYHPNFLSMNPILMKKYLLDSVTKQGERSCVNSRQPFSHFDFASVKDPFKICVGRLTHTSKLQSGAEFSLSTDAVFATIPCVSDYVDKEGCGDEKREDLTKLSYIHSPLGLKITNGKALLLTDASGGSGWESILGGFGKAADVTGGDPRTNTVVAFEMPLDFVIKKCLWEEILLQYRFVSDLTIKLLEGGFALQEHLLALRRYHFMEVADWADLFIMTLWHHKWYITEAVKRIPEIHAALELSVQRSSCQGDPHKNRLYLYVKGNSTNPPTSAIGIHSFDFLRLGYRVDWPVNIILTPDALKIYSEIFNFLIQVKLAASFLTDAWCLLKSLVQLTKKIHRSGQQKQELCHISALLETRHLVNHFVCTLQQYVQSQLSHVSWCRFLHSLKHKVKDLMDLESVHFAYLAESLHICFLSDETRPIANIIQSILQCSVDFRSCLIGSSLGGGSDEETLLSKLSRVDINQVLAVRNTFAKNVRDLYLLYIKSPKHIEFGISHFWNYLNYNDYYSEIVAQQIGRHALSF